MLLTTVIHDEYKIGNFDTIGILSFISVITRRQALSADQSNELRFKHAFYVQVVCGSVHFIMYCNFQ